METFVRRYILRTSLLSFAYLCGVAPKLVARSRAANRTLEWNAFTDQLESAAREFYLKQTASEVHVRTVERLLRRLNLNTPRLADIPVEESNSSYPYPEFRDLLRSTQVQVTLLSFSAGERTPHHNHPSMTGVMTCVRESSPSIITIMSTAYPKKSGSSGRFLVLSCSRETRAH